MLEYWGGLAITSTLTYLHICTHLHIAILPSHLHIPRLTKLGIMIYQRLGLNLKDSVLLYIIWMILIAIPSIIILITILTTK